MKRSWTGEEIKLLLSMREQGKSYKAMAKALSRTPASVGRKLDRLGVVEKREQEELVEESCPLCGRKNTVGLVNTYDVASPSKVFKVFYCQNCMIEFLDGKVLPFDMDGASL